MTLFIAFYFFIMRYHYEEPEGLAKRYGQIYRCNHPIYTWCTLFIVGERGLAVIRQYFDSEKKVTYWKELDRNLTADIYLNDRFEEYFQKHAKPCKNGLYPTVTVRQIMWALRMKPLPKKRWETVFDRKEI